jgi:hypothetical protein
MSAASHAASAMAGQTADIKSTPFRARIIYLRAYIQEINDLAESAVQNLVPMEKDKAIKVIHALVGADRPPLLKAGALGMGMVIGVTFASEALSIAAMQSDMPHSENEPAPLGTFMREIRPPNVSSTPASVTIASLYLNPLIRGK